MSQSNPITWSQTLPFAHGRGRGIVRRVDTGNQPPHVNSNPRSSTPNECPGEHQAHKQHLNNVPGTRCEDVTRNESGTNVGTCPSRSISRQSLIGKNSTRSIENLNDASSMFNPALSHIKKLDWNEEVEKQDLQNKMTGNQNINESDRPQKSRRRRRTDGGKKNASARSSSRSSRRDRSRNRSSSRDTQRSYDIRENSKSLNSGTTEVGNNCSYRDIDNNRQNRVRRDSHSKTERTRCDSDHDQNWRNDLSTVDAINAASNKLHCAPGLIVLPFNSDLTKPSANNCLNSNTCQRMLYDPNNPDRPIMVTQSNSSRTKECSSLDAKRQNETNALSYIIDQYGISKPPWYDPSSTNFQSAKYPEVVINIEKLDCQLQWILKSGSVLGDWDKVQKIRYNLEQYLSMLLAGDIKFCQAENVEHHFWKIMFYSLIEILRKSMTVDIEKKDSYQNTLLTVIDEGLKFYERLLAELEQTYNFNLEEYLGSNAMLPPKGLGFVGLALVASQKIFLFLGDLARYREQICETGNYSKSKQYYMKAQQVNPKNGRPYNQLAILSIYARRKLDAVYYYMRSLMSSNPFHSARDSLLSLFDENRKKYESIERKRREELDKQRNKDLPKKNDGIRTEIWIHPEDQRQNDQDKNSDCESDEVLSQLSSIELNKRFIISYLHVHGKLITRIGMESFRCAARQMLQQFRLLLQRSPLPINTHRLLQLVALNMFAVDAASATSTINRNPLDTSPRPSEESGKRTEIQERALGAALEMSSLLLERCITLVTAAGTETPPPDPPGSQAISATKLLVPADVQVMLPAIKVWCDWLLCHISVWNPPPPSKDLRIGSTADMWSRLAKLIGLLEKLNYRQIKLTSGPKDGHNLVRLQEDATLCGFTPLMYAAPENVYVPDTVEPEAAQIALRLHKVLFFGTEFLCGVDPPVLKSVARGGGGFEYVSVLPEEVDKPPPPPPTYYSDDSDSEERRKKKARPVEELPPNTSEEVRMLLKRKEELELQHRLEAERIQRLQEIVAQDSIVLEMEVRPRILVADTNCFIDYLDELLNIAKSNLYTLMVPLIVLKELEGLSRGIAGVRNELAHQAKSALDALRLRRPCIKFVTSRGNVYTSSSFTAEDNAGETDVLMNNDDRILAAAMALCKPDNHELTDSPLPDGSRLRKIKRDVVLITMDRNLRVKALATDLPVRALPDFVKWNNRQT